MYVAYDNQAIKTRQSQASHDECEHKRQAQHLDDILADWHHYSASYNLVHGFPTVDAACRLYRSSRQYDDSNGALGVVAWVSMMQAVDHLIDEVQQPDRTALAFQARNFHSRAQVWSSPRLPVCPHARAKILVDARKKLLEKLTQANLL
jgi:hypothetical protein